LPEKGLPVDQSITPDLKRGTITPENGGLVFRNPDGTAWQLTVTATAEVVRPDGTVA